MIAFTENDDNESEDSWYEQMQAQFDNREVESISPSLLSHEISQAPIGEDQYFEKVNEYGCSSSIFLPEENQLWQNLVEPASAPLLVTSEDSDLRSVVLNWLFSNLPGSSKFYGQVLRCKSDSICIYTDDARNPSAVLITSVSGQEGYYDLSLFVAAATEEVVFSRIARQIDTLIAKQLVFGDLSPELLPILSRHFRAHIPAWSSCPYGLYALSCSYPPIFEVQSPYRIGKLRFVL